MKVKRFRSLQIKSIMETPTEYSSTIVQPETSIREVASQLQQSRYHMVTVVNEDNVPIGLLTQTDMMKNIEQGRDMDPDQDIKSLMKSDMVKISEEKTIDDVLSLMNLLEVNKVIVVGPDDTFKGVLHKMDIIRKAQELL